MKKLGLKLCRNLTMAGLLVGGMATGTVASSVEKVHFLIPG